MLPEFWKEARDPSDIYASLSPLLFIAASSGITPLSMSGRKGFRKLKVTQFRLCVTFFNICVMIACYMQAILRNETIVGYFFDNEVSRIGNVLQLMSGIVVITVIYSVSMYKRHAIVGIVRNLANIDEQLLTLGVKVKYKKLLVYAYIHFVFQLTLNFVYLIGSYRLLTSMDIYPSASAYMTFFCPYIVTTVVVIMFSCIIKLISERFIVLNKVSNPWEIY